MAGRKTLDIDFLTLRKVRPLVAATNRAPLENYILSVNAAGEGVWVNTISNIYAYGVPLGGATGPTGAVGATGPTGATGPAGVDGSAVNTGATGPTGSAGADAYGLFTYKSSPTTDANTWFNSGSATIAFPNTMSAANASWIAALQASLQTLQPVWIQIVQGSNIQSIRVNTITVGSSTTTIQYSSSTIPPSWVNNVSTCFYYTVAGETGATGAIGATGATGPTGATGATGPAGADGDAANTGATGPTGPAGAAGTASNTGATGPTGSFSPTGTYYSDYVYWDPSGSQWSVGSANVHLGQNAGLTMQGNGAVAIGIGAGSSTQGTYGIAIGNYAGSSLQGIIAIAIGNSAGLQSQQPYSIAIGNYAGTSLQGQSAVAIGNGAGLESQGDDAIAVGRAAGSGGQGTEAIAIGLQAGQNSQGTNAIAIGSYAGQTSQPANSIAINALGDPGAPLNPDTSGFFVQPIRPSISNENTKNLLCYDGTARSEIMTTSSVVVDGSGHLLPTASYTYDLGSSNAYWRDVYLSTGTIYLGPTGTIGADGNGNVLINARNTQSVGIGTTAPVDNPFTILDVSGGAYFGVSGEGALRIAKGGGTPGNTFIQSGRSKAAGTNNTLIFSGIGGGNQTLAIDVSNQRVGINTTTLASGASLDVSGTAYFGISGDGALRITNAEKNTYIQSGLIKGSAGSTLNNTLIFGSIGASRNVMAVDMSEQRVGVGTMTPRDTLDVSGSAYFGPLNGGVMRMTGDGTYSYIQSGATRATGSSNTLVFTSIAGGGTTSPALAVDVANKRVGMGTTTPTVALDVSGASRISGNLTVDTNTLFVDATNNRVGVGTTTPQYALDVNGTLKFTTMFAQRLSSYSYKYVLTADKTLGAAPTDGWPQGGFLSGWSGEDTTDNALLTNQSGLLPNVFWNCPISGIWQITVSLSMQTLYAAAFGNITTMERYGTAVGSYTGFVSEGDSILTTGDRDGGNVTSNISRMYCKLLIPVTIPPPL